MKLIADEVHILHRLQLSRSIPFFPLFPGHLHGLYYEDNKDHRHSHEKAEQVYEAQRRKNDYDRKEDAEPEKAQENQLRVCFVFAEQAVETPHKPLEVCKAQNG